jgi:Protein of unknown function (DUF1152)
MTDPRASTLLVGVGSGNDTAGTLIALDLLPELPGPVDILGILPPWGWHRFQQGLEIPSQGASTGRARFRLSEPEQALPGFYEPQLCSIARRFGYPVRSCRVLSMQFGFPAMRQAFRTQIDENEYDQVVGVDFGGDVLGSNRDAGSLATPMVDFTALTLLGELAGACLLVVGPGSDGEIPASRFSGLLDELAARGAAARSIGLDDAMRPDARFCRAQKALREVSGGHSHTMFSLEAAARNQLPPNRVLTYRRIFRTPRREFVAEFPCELAKELSTSCLQFDAPALAATVDRPQFEGASPLDLCLALKCWGSGGTELDGAFVSLNPGDPLRSPYVWILTPGAVFSGGAREEILESGIQAVLDGSAPAAVVAEADLDMRAAQRLRRSPLAPGFALAERDCGDRQPYQVNKGRMLCNGS